MGLGSTLVGGLGLLRARHDGLHALANGWILGAFGFGRTGNPPGGPSWSANGVGAGAGSDAPVSDVVESAFFAVALESAQIRTLVWCYLVLMGVLLLAYFTNPTDASFRTFLTDLSFHQHLRRLHHNPPPAAPSYSSRSKTGTSSFDSSSHPEDGSASDPSSPSTRASTYDHRTASVTGKSHVLTFANRISVSLRTPPYERRNFLFFTIVTVTAGEPDELPLASTSFARRSRRRTNRRRSQDTSSSPSAWYVGAFGRWWIGSTSWIIDQDDPLLRPLGEPEEMDERGNDEEEGSWGVIGMKALDDGMSTNGLMDLHLRENPEPTFPTKIGRGSRHRTLSKEHPPPALRARSRQSSPSRSARTTVPPPAGDVDVRGKTTSDPCPHDKRPSPSSPLPESHRPTNGSAHHARTTSVSSSTPIPDPLHNAHSPSDDADPATGCASSPPAAITSLLASLATSQSSITDLRAQIDQVEAASAATRAQLQASLDDMRTKKREEDTQRSDIKGRMKQLDEGKRQAEATKREAERRLKTARNLRDAIVRRIENMGEEIEKMRARMGDNEKRKAESEERRRERTTALMQEIEDKQRAIAETETAMAELNAKAKHLEERIKEEKRRLEDAKQEVIEKRKASLEIARENQAAAASALAAATAAAGGSATMGRATNRASTSFPGHHPALRQSSFPNLAAEATLKPGAPATSILESQVLPRSQLQPPSSPWADPKRSAMSLHGSPISPSHPLSQIASTADPLNLSGPFDLRDFADFGPGASSASSVPSFQQQTDAHVRSPPTSYFDVPQSTASSDFGLFPSLMTASEKITTPTAAEPGGRGGLTLTTLPARTPSRSTTGSSFDGLVPSSPLSPFSSNLLPSNLFQNLDDDATHGVLRGARSEAVEAALGRFGLDNSDTSDAGGESDVEGGGRAKAGVATATVEREGVADRKGYVAPGDYRRRVPSSGILSLATTPRSVSDSLFEGSTALIDGRLPTVAPRPVEHDGAMTTSPIQGSAESPALGADMDEGSLTEATKVKRRSFGRGFPKMSLNPSAKSFSFSRPLGFANRKTTSTTSPVRPEAQVGADLDAAGFPSSFALPGLPSLGASNNAGEVTSSATGPIDSWSQFALRSRNSGEGRNRNDSSGGPASTPTGSDFEAMKRAFDPTSDDVPYRSRASFNGSFRDRLSVEAALGGIGGGRTAGTGTGSRRFTSPLHLHASSDSLPFFGHTHAYGQGQGRGLDHSGHDYGYGQVPDDAHAFGYGYGHQRYAPPGRAGPADEQSGLHLQQQQQQQQASLSSSPPAPHGLPPDFLASFAPLDRTVSAQETSTSSDHRSGSAASSAHVGFVGSPPAPSPSTATGDENKPRLRRFWALSSKSDNREGGGVREKEKDKAAKETAEVGKDKEVAPGSGPAPSAQTTGGISPSPSLTTTGVGSTPSIKADAASIASISTTSSVGGTGGTATGKRRSFLFGRLGGSSSKSTESASVPASVGASNQADAVSLSSNEANGSAVVDEGQSGEGEGGEGKGEED